MAEDQLSRVSSERFRGDLRVSVDFKPIADLRRKLLEMRLLTGTSTPQQVLAEASNDAAQRLRKDLVNAAKQLTTLDSSRIEQSIVIVHQARDGDSAARVVMLDESQPLGFFDVYSHGQGVASVVYKAAPPRQIRGAFVPTKRTLDQFKAGVRPSVILQRRPGVPRLPVRQVHGPSIKDIFTDHPDVVKRLLESNRRYLVERITKLADEMIARARDTRSSTNALGVLGDILGG